MADGLGYLNFLEEVEPRQFSIMSSLSTKEELEKRIKSMENSAASVVCSLLACQTPQKNFIDDIISLVALLGTVKSPELSRFCIFVSLLLYPTTTN